MKIVELIPEQEIYNRAKELGKQISEDFAGETVHLIGILKGSVNFLVELAKHITVPVTMDFMSVSSYGDAMVSSGVVRIIKDTDQPMEGRNVIVVEDIIDTGRTLSYLLALLEKRNPKCLKICTLLDKPERREMPVSVDYVGFIVPDKYIVGCGLDYQQNYRNLPYIGAIEDMDE